MWDLSSPTRARTRGPAVEVELLPLDHQRSSRAGFRGERDGIVPAQQDEHLRKRMQQGERFQKRELGVFEDRSLASLELRGGGREQVEGSAGPPWRRAWILSLKGRDSRTAGRGGEISDLHLRNVV